MTKTKKSLREWAIENNKEYIIDEWDTEKNLEELGLTIDEITHGSRKRVYWKCSKNKKHKWMAVISSRIRNKKPSCNICNNKIIIEGDNDVLTTHPEIILEWDYEKNGDLKPTEISYGCKLKVHWKCIDKGHEWEAAVYNRTRSNGSKCPFCNNHGTSYPEQFLYLALKSKFNNVQNGVIIGGYEYDIYIEDIDMLIEYDGFYYHRVLKNMTKIEIKKELIAKQYGYSFFRIKESEDATETVLKDDFITVRKNYNEDDFVKAFKLLIIYINKKYSKNKIDVLPQDINAEVIENMKKIKYEKSLEYKNPEIAKDLDKYKNGGLKASQIFAGSKKQLYWICPNNNEHRWRATPKARTGKNKTSCPFCNKLNMGRKIYQYSEQGELITIHNSINEAEESTNYFGISYSIKNEIKNKSGYIFSYNEKQEVEFLKIKNHYSDKTRAVYKYDVNGEFVIKYESIAQAKIKTNYTGVGNAAKTERPNKTGYIFSFIDKREIQKEVS